MTTKPSITAIIGLISAAALSACAANGQSRYANSGCNPAACAPPPVCCYARPVMYVPPAPQPPVMVSEPITVEPEPPAPVYIEPPVYVPPPAPVVAIGYPEPPVPIPAPLPPRK